MIWINRSTALKTTSAFAEVATYDPRAAAKGTFISKCVAPYLQRLKYFFYETQYGRTRSHICTYIRLKKNKTLFLWRRKIKHMRITFSEQMNGSYHAWQGRLAEHRSKNGYASLVQRFNAGMQTQLKYVPRMHLP
jgi:hypothetical protein